MKKQVRKEHYGEDYDDMTRFISYFYQIDLVKTEEPENVLEIGVGNKTVSDYLKREGYDVTTCDYDKNLNPDHTADIRDLPFEKNSFDVVLAFEVLEHLPFEESKKALKELSRVSKNKVIISIPYFGYELNFLLKFKGIQKIFGKEIFDLLIKLPAFFKKKKFDGEHYWEMGYKGFSKKRVKKELKKIFKIEKEVRPKIDTYHYFFVLKNK